MITITKEAIERIKTFAKDEGIDHHNVRVRILGGGCGGLQYDMYYDDLPPTDLDEIFEQDGITIIVDCLSLTYMRGEITLDYIESEFGSGFKFISNDDSLKSCGCGNSFNV